MSDRLALVLRCCYGVLPHLQEVLAQLGVPVLAEPLRRRASVWLPIVAACECHNRHLKSGHPDAPWTELSWGRLS
jgi:hypothetical protein